MTNFVQRKSRHRKMKAQNKNVEAESGTINPMTKQPHGATSKVSLDGADAPGEGGFVRNFAGTPMTITFVGEVMQGNLTNNVPNAYSIRSSQVPQAGAITTTLLYAPNGGDQVFKYNNGYTTFTFDADDLVWVPSEPSFNVGEAFFSRRFGAGDNWVRKFTVP
jgi:hypothetical protein